MQNWVLKVFEEVKTSEAKFLMKNVFLKCKVAVHEQALLPFSSAGWKQQPMRDWHFIYTWNIAIHTNNSKASNLWEKKKKVNFASQRNSSNYDDNYFKYFLLAYYFYNLQRIYSFTQTFAKVWQSWRETKPHTVKFKIIL